MYLNGNACWNTHQPEADSINEPSIINMHPIPNFQTIHILSNILWN